MTVLITTANLVDPDGLFEALVEAHHNFSADESRLFDARLVLLLANHIGDAAVIRAAIAAAQPDPCAPAG